MLVGDEGDDKGEERADNAEAADAKIHEGVVEPRREPSNKDDGNPSSCLKERWWRV